jgi:DnaJ-domain-containing protein 1
MDEDDVRRLIARLAVAVVAADGRITAAEMAALERLDVLGLGPLAELAREEIERAIQQPVDVRATCAALPPLRQETAAVLLTVLAELAATDRLLAPREREVFAAVAGHLGVGAATAAHILEAAMSPRPHHAPEDVAPRLAPGEPPAQRALRALGLAAGASRSDIESNYLDLVQRYDPARVAEMGPEFAALAVRRLASITDAYEAALAALGPSA